MGDEDESRHFENVVGVPVFCYLTAHYEYGIQF